MFRGSRNGFSRPALLCLGTVGQEELTMKRLLLAATALTFLAGPVMAQSVGIAPEQRKVIKEYVVKEKIRRHKLQSRVTVGALLPADVELAPVPQTWGPSFGAYRYVYTGDDVVLVDPSSRRVVEVID